MENNKHLRAAFRCPWRIVNNPPDQWAFFDAHSITYITPKISRQRSDFQTFLKRERNWPRLRWCWPAWEIPYPMGAGGLPGGKMSCMYVQIRPTSKKPWSTNIFPILFKKNSHNPPDNITDSRYILLFLRGLDSRSLIGWNFANCLPAAAKP